MSIFITTRSIHSTKIYCNKSIWNIDDCTSNITYDTTLHIPHIYTYYNRYVTILNKKIIRNMNKMCFTFHITLLSITLHNPLSDS